MSAAIPDPDGVPGPMPGAPPAEVWGCMIEWLVCHTKPSVEGTPTSRLFVLFVYWYVDHCAAQHRAPGTLPEVWFAALLDDLGYPAATRSAVRALAVTHR